MYNFSEAIKKVRELIKKPSGTAISARAMAELLLVDKEKYSKWEQGFKPSDSKERKVFMELFQIKNLEEQVTDNQIVEAAKKIEAIRKSPRAFALGKNANMRLRPEEFAEAFPDWQGVPVYNTEVTASFVEKYTDADSRWEPLYYLRDPQFRDCNFAARIAGDSMHSEIRHGDYIICQEIIDKSVIVFGDIYYVVTVNGLQTCKYINAFPIYDPNYKGKTQLYDYDKVLLVPKNDSISPTPLKKTDIQRLYKVKGIVRGY